MPDLCFLDFEASILGREGYPTEVAYIGPKGIWSALIKPLPHWTAWDPAEEQATGISRAMLENDGLEPADVCRKLEADLAGLVAYVTHPFDAKWLRVLASHSLGRNERVIAANAYSLWGQDGMAAYRGYIAENPPARRAMDEATAAYTFHTEIFLAPRDAGVSIKPGAPDPAMEAVWDGFQPRSRP